MDPDQTINQPLRAAVEHAVAGGESLYSIAGGAGMDSPVGFFCEEDVSWRRVRIT